MSTIDYLLDAPASDPATPRSLAVRAEDLTLAGNRGLVYGPLDLAIPRGSITLVSGRAGSGKTALLLTLVGRMRATGGRLEVLGYDLPRRARSVQHRTSAMGFAGLDDLDEEVTVAATIREREAWLAPWYAIVRQPDDARVAEVCQPVFGDELPIPTARQIVHELDEASNLLLRIALALLSEPELIVVDELDQLHDTGRRDIVWERLRVLADAGLTVVTSASGSKELDRLGWATPPLHVALPQHD